MFVNKRISDLIYICRLWIRGDFLLIWFNVFWKVVDVNILKY